MVFMAKCPNCKGKMKVISKKRTLPDPEYVDMSDEELIDFFAEDITGDYKDYGVTVVRYQCTKCGKKYKRNEDKGKEVK